MQLEQLVKVKDEYAMRLAQDRTFSHNVRDTYFTWFKGDEKMTLAEKMKAKAAALKSNKKPAPATKKASNGKTSSKNSKNAASKEPRKSTRVQITDAKGKAVTGRDGVFKCPECSHEITGPWSYKTHLVKVHSYSRKKAGLREE